MFRKKIITRYQIPEFCPHCKKSVIREEVKHVLCFFFIELFPIKERHFLKCQGCQRSLLRKNLLATPPVPPPSLIERRDGTIEETTYRKEGTKLIRNINRDYKNKLPKTDDPVLLSSTILAIMKFVDKVEPKANVTASFNYKNIQDRYQNGRITQDAIISEIDSLSESDAESKIIEMFRNCKVEFRKNEMDFILSQGISVTRNLLLVPIPVEELFKQMLLIDGYPELQLDSVLLEYRARWF